MPQVPDSNSASCAKLSHPSPEATKKVVRILCLGDIVGSPGRQIVKETVPFLRQQLRIDLVIGNGENSAGGIGITPATAKTLRSSGVDIITTGNHVWRHPECYSLLETADYLIRPANYGTKAPGKGLCFATLPGEVQVAVLNLAGRTSMQPADCPFAAADALLASIPQSVSIIIVDFHAEATSEKRAMGLYLDGRVSACLGTHTHVQTADAFILPGKTAVLSDLGMCGVEETSVLGMSKETILHRFTTGLPKPFKPARGTMSINGALLEIDSTTGHARSISLVRHRPSVCIDAGYPVPNKKNGIE